FSRFIDDELSALLDGKYRIDTQNQAVFGHSFGALYGLYSLFTRPERFRHYLLVSPSIWWQDRRVLDWLPGTLPQGIGIRLGAGEHEGRNNRPDQTSRGMVAQAKILAGTLHHLGADVRFTLYPNANHGNAPFYALTDCIEYLRSTWQR
ncbi:MAG: alpha/beta hydrolase-fold protein, partial [Neisseria mucosa]|nr:alpha/beta hydrolase-fold protein [Neisseria mucosa]